MMRHTLKQLEVTAVALAAGALLASCAATPTAQPTAAELDTQETAEASTDDRRVNSNRSLRTAHEVAYGPEDYSTNYLLLHAVHTDEDARNFVLQTAYQYASAVNNSITGELSLGRAVLTPDLLDEVANLANGTSAPPSAAGAEAHIGLLTVNDGSLAPLRGGPPGAQPTLRNGHGLLIVFQPEDSLQANTIVANDTDMRSILELTDLRHIGPVHVKT